MKYFIGIDRGHSGVRAGCYDLKGNYISGANIEVPLYHPAAGQSVCKPEELKESVLRAVKETIGKAPEPFRAEDVLGVSFSIAGGPLVGIAENGSYPLDIVFPDDGRRVDRGFAMERLKKAGITAREYADAVSTFPPWIVSDILSLKDVEKEKAKKVKHWAVSEHAIITMALGAEESWETECRGSMHYNYNPVKRAYDERICRAVELYGSDFLPLHFADEKCGTVSKEASEKTGLQEGTPLYMGMNDVNTQVIAQGAVEEGDAIANYGTFGTAGFIREGGISFRADPETTRSLHVTGGGFRNNWWVGAVIRGCGASYSWLNHSLCGGISGAAGAGNGMGRNWYQEMNAAAARSPIGANGLIYYPDIIDGKASFSHIGTQTTLADMIRAVLEGIAYEMLCGIREIEKASDSHVKRLFIGGGLTESKEFTQMLADMYDMEIIKAAVNPDMVGTKGAAMICGIGAGVFANVQDAVKEMASGAREVFTPKEENRLLYKQYKERLQETGK